MPFASDMAYAADNVTLTYEGSVYSYNSSGGKPAENIHGMFSVSGGDIAYCAEHAQPTPMGSHPQIGATATVSKSQYTGTNAFFYTLTLPQWHIRYASTPFKNIAYFKHPIFFQGCMVSTHCPIISLVSFKTTAHDPKPQFSYRANCLSILHDFT